MRTIQLALSLALLLGACSSEPMDNYRPVGDLFSPRIDLPVGAEPKAVAIADIDGDGRKDIVVARATGSGAITVLYGSGDGMFRRADVSNAAGDTPWALAVADFDKDGALDVAVVNYLESLDGKVAALFGKDFQTKVALASSGSHPSALAGADLDGNGAVDLVTSNQVGANLNVYLNQGGRVFSAPTPIALGETPGGVVAGDLDGDGPSKLDIAVALSDSGRLRVISGLGGGAFSATKMTDYSVGQTPDSVALGRIDGDALFDLAVANLGDGTVSVLYAALGNGGFAMAQSYKVAQRPAAVAIGDLDGDGFGDVIVSNRGSDNLSVLRGQPSGKLSASGEAPVGMGPEGVAVGDLNGDGLLDVAVANLMSDTVSVFLTQKAR